MRTILAKYKNYSKVGSGLASVYAVDSHRFNEHTVVNMKAIDREADIQMFKATVVYKAVIL